MEVLFTPADYESLKPADLKHTVCVVFDVLRATSSMTAALFHGAASVRPTHSVAEALRLKAQEPRCLLAGERNGLRIRSDVTGSIDFDLGNSPREFTRAAIKDRHIIMTTTNGTRALHACRGARLSLICSFLNLRATADHLLRMEESHVLLICSGTGEHTAYEDVLGAGALADILWAEDKRWPRTDSARMALCLYQQEASDLAAGLARANNGERLMSLPDLRDDVAFCATRDRYPIVAGTTGEAPIAAISR